GAQGEGPRPGRFPGGVRPQVGPADGRAALLYGGRHRRLSLGRVRLRGLRLHGARFAEPPGALDRRRGLLDGRRGRQVPLRPRQALYLGRGDSPPYKDAVFELLPFWPLGHGRRGGPDALRDLPGLRPAPGGRRPPRHPLPRLPRRPLPRRRARRRRHRARDRGAGPRRGGRALV
ncbi:MAG: hypothetical protein AVDCRST_MAG12-1525, partial [uncultured Rubrobacteraceae bacterium]